MYKEYDIVSDCRGMDAVEIMDTIFSARKIEDEDKYLFPSEDDMIRLFALRNIGDAYRVISNAVEKDLPIAILADCDLDGITSATIMYRYLHDVGATDVECFINEGKAHGLIEQDLSRFDRFEVVVIPDSLDKDVSQYKKLRESGKEVVVLDHHDINPEVKYDDYIILASSQRDYPNKALSGAGVVLKFCLEYDYLKQTEYANKYFDLATAGLIGDMMDMSVPENRYIAYKGFNNLINPALQKIVGGFPYNSTAVSFSIAPLVNAAMRVNQNELALKTFLCDDEDELKNYIKQLKKCKDLQNEEVERLLPEIIEQAETQLDEKFMVFKVNSEYDIKGLLGNRLLADYQRPLIVVDRADGFYSGSARAIGVEDFRKMCADTGLCEAQGHELAHGVSIAEEDFDEFVSKIRDELKDLELTQTIRIDAVINVEDITTQLIDMVKRFDLISGTSSPALKFQVRGLTDYEVGDMSKGKHLVLKGENINYIKWNYTDGFDKPEECSMFNIECSVVGSLNSGFIGRTFMNQVIVDDIEYIS